MRKKLSLALVLAGISASSGALGAPHTPPIRVFLRACRDIRETEVERIVSAELGSEPSQAEPASDPTWIVVSCDTNHVLIEVVDVVSRKTLRRNFDFGRASPKARARLIAIASSELVLAGWAELALNPHLRVEPEGPPPSAERKEAARTRASAVRPEAPPLTIEAAEQAAWNDAFINDDEITGPRQRFFDELPPSQRRFRISALASAHGFFASEGVLLGGGLRLSEERLVRTCWSLDALYETGSFSLGGRDFTINSWSLGGILYLYARGRYVTGRIGAGLRAGLTTATTSELGPVEQTTRVLTPWGWPMLATSVSLGRPPLTFEMAGEGGYVAVPISPTSQGGVSMRGLWYGAQLGLSLHL